jgi:ATP-binding cassette, subfamily B, bacterial
VKGAWTHWKLFPQAVTYLRPYRLLSFTSIVMTGLSSVVALAEPWPLAIMVDSVLGDNPPPGFLSSWFGIDPGRYELLAIVVAAGFLQVILAHGLIVVHDYVNAKVEQNMVLDLRSQLFDHIQRLSLTFHDERRTGQLMQQVNLQASALGAVLLAFPPLAQSFLTLIGMLTIALLIDWQVTLISLVAVPMIYYALGLYGTRIVPRIQKVQSLEWQSISIA